jgi:ABC-type uncharacterized transport system substrate-binding protein
MPSRITLLLLGALTFVVSVPRVRAAEVVVVGDTELKLVAEVVSGIRKTLRRSMSTYPPAEVKGHLLRVLEQERARLVIALGRDALSEAQALPSDIPVIYGFVLTPPAISRPNTTGVYMATPVREYAELIDKYLSSIKSVAVVGSRDQLRVLDGSGPPRWDTYSVDSSVELVDTLKRLKHRDAILLLPNPALLTPAAMEETYLLSFRRGIPLLGVSEKQVRDGALLALVVDLSDLGRRIGEYASRVISGTPISELPPAPARHPELYLNTETARKMGIRIPEAVLRAAKGVYP